MAFYTKIPVLVRQNTTVIANVTYNYPGLVYNISGLYRPGHAKFPTAPHWNFSISVDQTFTLVPNTLYLWPTQRDFVSGFYGPGPWAAWTISIVTTWIALFRDDYSNNMHLMGWLLYTNWAAIDMARQLINCHGLNPVPVDPYFTVGASLSILYMGMLHCFLQCRMCLHKQAIATMTERGKVRLRLFILTTGSIMPAVVLVNGLVMVYPRLQILFFLSRSLAILLGIRLFLRGDGPMMIIASV
ncbi:hypothetical protein PtrEW13061_011938 [Pyrenophora tritici-repentis]|nr:hypothetical protein PtrEW13061_011938 [Pyrenophora tritici-repentis]